MTTPRHLVLMGPAGAGKSTVGRRAAKLADVPFFEGDDFHPARNRAIIARGGALSDEDRIPWIDALGHAVASSGAPRSVVACSALTRGIRDRLAGLLPGGGVFALLDVPPEILKRRLAARQGHFAGPEILASQLAAMDDMADVTRLDATRPIARVAAEAAKLL